MKKTLFILFIFCLLYLGKTENIFAQKSIVDSLRKILDYTNEESTQGLQVLNKMTIALVNVRPSDALLNTDKAIALAEKLNNREELASAYNNKGFVQIRMNNYAQANALLDKAGKIYFAINNTNGIASVNCNRAELLRRQGNLDSAKIIFSITLKDFEKLNSRNEIADVCYYLGLIERNLGNDSDWTVLNERAIMLYRQTGNIPGYALALNSKACQCMYTQKYTESIEQFNKCISINTKIGNIYGLSLDYGNIGSLYTLIPDYPKAIDFILKAARLNEELGSKYMIAYNYSLLGTIYLNLKLLDQAEEYTKKGIRLMSELNTDNFTTYNSFHNLARIYLLRNKYAESLEQLQKALQHELASKDFFNVSECLMLTGDAYLKLQQFDSAFVYYDRSIKYVYNHEDFFNLSLNYIGIGQCIMLASETDLKKNNFNPLNRIKDAELYFNKALQLGKENKLIEAQRDCCKQLWLLYEKIGDNNKSFKYYKHFVELRDSVVNFEITNQVAIKQMDYENELKVKSQKADQDKKDVLALAELNKQKIIRNSVTGGLAAVALFSVALYRQRNKISKERKRSDNLLLNILPGETAEELKSNGTAEAKYFEQVTVMFTDFKDFTQISEKLSAKELVSEIHFCYSEFDKIISMHNLEKIKTIGDSYMCAGGLPIPNKTNAEDCVNAALEIAEFMSRRKSENTNPKFEMFEIRIGIHTGPVVAGIVGIKKFAYDIWGDTVNIASKMESSGEAGKVNISGATYEHIKNKFRCEYRGKISAKNKGEIDMYFVNTVWV